MMHVTDWLPTIVDGLLGKGELLSDLSTAQSTLDGVSQWDTIVAGSLDMESDGMRYPIPLLSLSPHAIVST
jgi:hypothetical protein